MKNNNYLGEEKLGILMIKFSLPCILSLLVSALYNIVDQIFIGNSELSALGNAATGVVFPIFIITQAFAWCFGDGCGAFLNICQGQNNTTKAKKAIGTGITLTFIISLILVAIFMPLKRQILSLFGASPNSIGMAIEYFNIIVCFFPVYMLSNMMDSVVRSDGSPEWSMASMLSGAVVNIILDPIFIFGLKWGMAGAALATVIGQTISFVVSVSYFFRTKTFKLSVKDLAVNFKDLLPAVKLGTSSFFTQLTIVIVALVCNIMLVKYGASSKYGVDIPIAIIGIESKVFTVVINLVVGIILGCLPIIGYNMGAKKYDRVKKLYLNILFCTVAIGLISNLFFELIPGSITRMFGTPTNIPNPEDYWDFAGKTFRIFLSLITFTCVIKMTSIFFQSVGKPMQATITSLVRDLVCFIPLIVILPRHFGIIGILFAAPCADFVAIILAAIFSVSFFKNLEKDQTSSKTESVEAVIKPSHKGVILTIAREHGSCGKEIAEKVASMLGIKCYYKEMTAIAAKECGLDKEFISNINKNEPDLMRSLYLSSEVVSQAIKAQSEVLHKIAESGSCVIVGRAADYVLREDPNTIKVFIHAPEEYKIQSVMKKYGDSLEVAKKNIRHSDEARSAYYKNISGLNWGDSHNYDLCLDSSIGIEKCSEIICALAKTRA